MTRDHKLILGGALCGVSGGVFALGLWVLSAALLCVGMGVIGMAGKANG